MNPSAEQEQQWLAELRTGSETALRRIFDTYYKYLLAETHRILPDEDTCKDLVQEVFVELWRKRSELDVRLSLRAYLRRAVTNRTFNHLKSQKRYQFGQTDETLADAVLPDEAERHHAQNDLETALHAAIQTLPEKCRLVFSLSRFEELSHREIAERLGISTKTIENQITKALRTLRETLVRYPDLSAIGILLTNLWLANRG